MKTSQLLAITFLAVLQPRISHGSIAASGPIDTLPPIAFDSVTGLVPLNPIDIHELRETIEGQELELIQLNRIMLKRDTTDERRMERYRTVKRQQKEIRRAVNRLLSKDATYVNIYEQYRATMQEKDESCETSMKEFEKEIGRLERRNWWTTALAIIATIGGTVIAVAF